MWRSSRVWIARWLRRMATWIDPSHDALLEAARVRTRAWAPHDCSGEHKRHQVYAALIKAFPGARKRDIAFAIERVLQED